MPDLAEEKIMIWHLSYSRRVAGSPYRSRLVFGAAQLQEATLNFAHTGADEGLRVRRLSLRSLLPRLSLTTPSKAPLQMPS